MSTDEKQYNTHIDASIQKKLTAKPVRLHGGRWGILLRVGPFIVAVSDEKALQFSDRITDAVERLDALRAQRITRGILNSHSAPLTAADGTPETPLPATSAERE